MFTDGNPLLFIAKNNYLSFVLIYLKEIFGSSNLLLALNQGCQTYGPRAGSGPLDGLIRPGLVENKFMRMSKKKVSL